MHGLTSHALLQSTESGLGWSSPGASPGAHCTLTMSPFVFRAIQHLNIEAADNPDIDVQDGRLVLTATRGGDQIMITAPLNSVLPSAVTTTVKAAPVQVRRVPRHLVRRSTFNKNVRRGESSPRSKLTEAQVREIKALLADHSHCKSYGSTNTMLLEMGKAYSVHYTTIYNIMVGKTWSHVVV